MNVWPFLTLSLLTACCPVPLRAQVTAFRAEVVGVSPEASALHLRPPQAPPLTLILADGVLHSSTGQSLPLGALEPGDRVYVQGTLTDGDLSATQVRHLE